MVENDLIDNDPENEETKEEEMETKQNIGGDHIDKISLVDQLDVIKQRSNSAEVSKPSSPEKKVKKRLVLPKISLF